MRAHAQRTMAIAYIHVHVRSHIAGRNMAVWLAFVFSFVYCVVSQAPGDGDSLCTDEFINGMPNPFVDNRPTYADNVRPLMDSRDYVILLEGEGDEGAAHVPRWQQVDNDNNNTDETVTEVRNLRTTYIHVHVPMCTLLHDVYILFPVESAFRTIMQWYTYSVWL